MFLDDHDHCSTFIWTPFSTLVVGAGHLTWANLTYPTWFSLVDSCNLKKSWAQEAGGDASFETYKKKNNVFLNHFYEAILWEN